jgi:hypothetical protein
MAVQNIGETLAEDGENRIHLRGRLTARLYGGRVEEGLPGRSWPPPSDPPDNSRNSRRFVKAATDSSCRRWPRATHAHRGFA